MSSDTQKSGDNSEMEEIFEKMESMNKDLDQKLEKIYEKSGLDRRKIEKYLSEVGNLPTRKREELEKKKALLTKNIWGAFKKRIQKARLKKKKEKVQKKRRGKTLGDRRGWKRM